MLLWVGGDSGGAVGPPEDPDATEPPLFLSYQLTDGLRSRTSLMRRTSPPKRSLSAPLYR